MGFIMRNESFSCQNCQKEVTLHPTGSARNHCPHCLYSLHVDDTLPGDRLATCHGLMTPVGIDHKKNK
jgi:RNHCP domain